MAGYRINTGRSIADEILDGLTEFADALESGDQNKINEFTCHRVVLDLKPKPYNSERVKSARKLLGTSQSLFARFLGASVKTVRSWEQGVAKPNPMACRFMDEIIHNPDVYRKRLQECIKPKKMKVG